MPFLNRKTTAREKNIFLYARENEANRNATINNDKIQLGADGKKSVAEGMFVALIGNEARYLPRATLTTATAANSPSVVCTPSQVFATGDVLYAVEPYATVTLGGTPGATTETVTVTVDGVALTTQIGSVVLADAAVAVRNAINADSILSQKVFAKSAGAVVYVFSLDGISTYSFAVAKAGDITVTESGALTSFAALLGTVASVNVATNTVTLGADASAVLPVGAHVGVRTGEILGVDAHSRDYTDESAQTIGLYNVSSGVRENYLPYVDGDIKRRLPRLNFVTRA